MNCSLSHVFHFFQNRVKQTKIVKDNLKVTTSFSNNWWALVTLQLITFFTGLIFVVPITTLCLQVVWSGLTNNNWTPGPWEPYRGTKVKSEKNTTALLGLGEVAENVSAHLEPFHANFCSPFCFQLLLSNYRTLLSHYPTWALHYPNLNQVPYLNSQVG